MASGTWGEEWRAEKVGKVLRLNCCGGWISPGPPKNQFAFLGMISGWEREGEGRGGGGEGEGAGRGWEGKGGKRGGEKEE